MKTDKGVIPYIIENANIVKDEEVASSSWWAGSAKTIDKMMEMLFRSPIRPTMIVVTDDWIERNRCWVDPKILENKKLYVDGDFTGWTLTSRGGGRS